MRKEGKTKYPPEALRVPAGPSTQRVPEFYSNATESASRAVSAHNLWDSQVFKKTLRWRRVHVK